MPRKNASQAASHLKSNDDSVGLAELRTISHRPSSGLSLWTTPHRHPLGCPSGPSLIDIHPLGCPSGSSSMGCPLGLSSGRSWSLGTGSLSWKEFKSQESFQEHCLPEIWFLRCSLLRMVYPVAEVLDAQRNGFHDAPSFP